MNKVILIGNLTKDPEISTTSNGVSVCRFALAVTRRYTNANGDREADFINIVVWRALADNCHKFLKKGSKAAVVGTLQSRMYDATDGTVNKKNANGVFLIYIIYTIRRWNKWQVKKY